jgi:hypothetical protein
MSGLTQSRLPKLLVIPKRAEGERGTCCPPAAPKSCGDGRLGPSAERSDARVEQTLPSVAFDFDLGLDPELARPTARDRYAEKEDAKKVRLPMPALNKPHAWVLG